MNALSHTDSKNSFSNKITENEADDHLTHNTNNTQIVKNSEKINSNFQDYFKVSKDKLLKIKHEADMCIQSNLEKEDEIKQLNFKYNELLSYSEELSNRMDEIKEKINTSVKYKVNLQQEYVKILKETQENKRQIDSFKKKNEYKIKLMNNETGKNHYRCELNIDKIKEMTSSEIDFQKSLIDKISDITKEIEKYETLTKENKGKELNKDKFFDDAEKITKILKRINNKQLINLIKFVIHLAIIYQ